jgi:hypothetical protein
MNMARRAGFAAVSLLSIVACAGRQATSGAGGSATPTNPDPPAMTRAAAGDTVYLIEHHVRPGRGDEFVQFVDSILRPALQRKGVLRQTRLLHPLAPNPDGSSTYTFVLDPAVPGESYNVLDLLRQMYPEAEARAQYARFTDTWARDFTSRAYVQR